MKAALKNLDEIDQVRNEKHRDTTLHRSLEKLEVAREEYKSLLAESDHLETDLVYEELFCVAFLSVARCWAEMEEYDKAVSVMEDASITWHWQARRIANTLLLKNWCWWEDDWWQFLSRHTPNEAIKEAYHDWLDYADYLSHFENYEKRDEEPMIDATQKAHVARRLINRSSVLKGYVSQYEMLGQTEMRPSTFENGTAELVGEHDADDFLVLEPRIPMATESEHIDR